MSLTVRKRFSDITNITSNGRSERSGSSEQEAPNEKNSIVMLLKENDALMRIVEERNKMLEITGMQLQKLKISLQQANQQNWQLAQANSRMLAELNLGKDRLKAMQHELGCTTALLQAKNKELQEEKKLNKRFQKLEEKIATEGSRLKPNDIAVGPSHPPSCKRPFNINGKRPMRSRSLGPTTVTRQETAKERDEGRRKSLRRACNVKAEPTEDLFEIDDLKLLHRRSDEDGQHKEQRRACNVKAEPAEDLFEIADFKLPLHSDEDGHEEQSSSQSRNQALRRSWIGRPMRKAVEKVNSYKEVPVNVKMRRPE